MPLAKYPWGDFFDDPNFHLPCRSCTLPIKTVAGMDGCQHRTYSWHSGQASAAPMLECDSIMETMSFASIIDGQCAPGSSEIMQQPRLESFVCHISFPSPLSNSVPVALRNAWLAI